MSDVKDLSEIASIFAVTETAVRNWIAAGLPVVQRGTRGGARERTRISLQAAVAWYFKRNHERLELDRARTRLADEQARRLAMDNRERGRGLGKPAIWKRALKQNFAEMRNDLHSFASDVAPMLDPADINQRKDVLQAAVHRVLNHWADSAYRLADNGDKKRS